MCGAYVGATQIVDRQVLPSQFSRSQLDRDVVWSLVEKTTCEHDPYFDHDEKLSGARVVVTFADGAVLEKNVDAPKGFDSPVPNKMLLEKFEKLTDGIIDVDRRSKIVDFVLNLEKEQDVKGLIDLLANKVKAALE